jgi:hypothetical protein
MAKKRKLLKLKSEHDISGHEKSQRVRPQQQRISFILLVGWVRLSQMFLNIGTHVCVNRFECEFF